MNETRYAIIPRKCPECGEEHSFNAVIIDKKESIEDFWRRRKKKNIQVIQKTQIAGEDGSAERPRAVSWLIDHLVNFGTIIIAIIIGGVLATIVSRGIVRFVDFEEVSAFVRGIVPIGIAILCLLIAAWIGILKLRRRIRRHKRGGSWRCLLQGIFRCPKRNRAYFATILPIDSVSSREIILDSALAEMVKKGNSNWVRDLSIGGMISPSMPLSALMPRYLDLFISEPKNLIKSWVSALLSLLLVIFYFFFIDFIAILLISLFGLIIPDIEIQFTELVPSSNIFIVMIAVIVSVLVVTNFYCRRLNKSSIAYLGFQRYQGWLITTGAGMMLGFFLVVIVFLSEVLIGGFTINRFAWQAKEWNTIILSLFGFMFLLILVSIREELMFRGFVLQYLNKRFGIMAAVSLSSVGYALMHSANPDVNPLAYLAIFSHGVFLSYAYLVTHSLWFGIGFHFSWNFFLGPVFSFPVSGFPAGGLIDISISSTNRAITGGDFGPEGSIVGLITIMLGIVALFVGHKIGFWRHKES